MSQQQSVTTAILATITLPVTVSPSCDRDILTCKARPGGLTLKQFQATPKRNLTLVNSLHKNSKEIIRQRGIPPLGMTLVSQFSRSVVSNSATPWIAARQASLSITNSRSLLKFMAIESVTPSNHLILCHPLLLPPSIFSSIRVFSKSALCMRWSKYWSCSFSISPSNEHSGLISFRMDWWDFLTVQGTLKSHLQHHSSKASILQCSAFFTVQLSHPYMTTGKTIALTRWTFVGKVMSLLLDMLSR